MRWEGLFRDLEAQLAAAVAAELAAEVEDRTRREVARLHLVDRLRMAVGAAVVLGVEGTAALHGELRDVGAGWLLLVTPGRTEALVCIPAIRWARGLPALAADPDRLDRVTARLDLAYALRTVARDRAPVAVTLRDATVVTGTIDRVGADFVDIAEHAPGEPRRAAGVQGARTVALGAVAVVRAD